MMTSPPPPPVSSEEFAKRIGTYADALSKPAAAVAAASAVIGSACLLVLAAKLPGGLPALDAPALAGLALPVAFVGSGLLAMIAMATGLAGVAYYNLTTGSQTPKRSLRFRDNVAETTLFASLAVASVVMLIVTGNGAPAWTLWAIPIVGWLSATFALRSWPWKDPLRHAALLLAGFLWFMPFLMALFFAQAVYQEQASPSASLAWFFLASFVVAASYTNYIGAIRGLGAVAIVVGFLMVVVIALSPTAMLGAPLRFLGWIDVVKTVKIDAAHPASDFFRGCSRKDVVPVRPQVVQLTVLNGLGTDLVFACNGRASWRTIRRDWIVSVEALAAKPKQP